MTEKLPPTAPHSVSLGFEELSEERGTLAKLDAMRGDLQLESSLRSLADLAEHRQHPLYALPEGASDTLIALQATAQEKLALLHQNLTGLERIGVSEEKKNLLSSLVQSFLADIQALETLAQQTARDDLAMLLNDAVFADARGELRSALNINGEQRTFEDLLRELSSPLEAPEKNPVQHDPQMQQKLTERHAALVQLQYELLAFTIAPALRELKERKEFRSTLAEDADVTLTKEEREAVAKALAAFLMQRRVYEARLNNREPEKASKLYLYLGVAAEEGAEELAEGKFSFKKLPEGRAPVLRFLRTPEWMQRLDAGTRQKMLEGFRDARLALGQKAPRLSQVLGSMERSPVGRQFWKQLLTIESPVTVMLYAMYVHTSGNPLKATLNYAAFLTTSAASNALLESAVRMLAQSAIWAQRARNFRTASALLKLARLPKNPVIIFAAALAIALGLSQVIDDITSWIDEKIPDTPEKQAVNNALNVVSGGSTIESVEFLAGEVGLRKADPETEAFSYLSQELLTVESGGMQRRKMNGITDWNGTVDRAITSEVNPLMQELWKLEYASGSGAWADRHAFELYCDVQRAQELERSIGAELAERGVLQNPQSFGMLWIATMDSGNDRPDWAVKRTEDDASGPQGKAIAYIKGLKEDDDLAKTWKYYRPLVQRIAEKVTTFLHLGMYKREQWLGANGAKGMPEMARRGIAAEISYQIARRDILTFREGNVYDKDSFMKLVTDVEQRRASRDVPMKLRLQSERPWPNPFTDIKGWLERLVIHNDLNKSATDDVHRHFLEKMLGAMNAETLQHKNAFKFRQLSEAILQECQEDPLTAMHALPLAYMEAMPDEELLKSAYPSTWWQDEFNALDAQLQKTKNPRDRLSTRVHMLEVFLNYREYGAAGVPILSTHKTFANDLNVAGAVKFFYRPRERRWYVHTRASASMPYIAISGLGSRHRFPDLNIGKVQPFSEWRAEHVEIARRVAPQLIWHEQWVRTLEQRIADEEAAVKKLETEEKERKTTEQEKTRENAKKQPLTWQLFGEVHGDRHYNYIAYHPGKRAFIYVQVPEMEQKSYVTAPGSPAPNTDVAVFMRIEAEDGTWCQGRVTGNEEQFWATYKEGKFKEYGRVFREALALPVLQTERMDRVAANRITLTNILAAYVNGGGLRNAQWRDQIETVLADRWYFRSDGRAQQFLTVLEQQIFEATRDGDTWKYLTQPAFRSAVEAAQKSTEEWVAEHEQTEKEQPAAKVRREGEALMHRINANNNGNYFTKQYGWIFNKYLYMQFDEEQGKWLAGLGSLEGLDPGSFNCNMYGGSESYNKLLADLDAVNHHREPSQ